MSGVQYTFDIVAAAKNTALLGQAVLGLSKIMRYCYREGVDPLTAASLERLGGWLMVDADRLREGERILESVPAPKVWRLGPLTLLVGVDNDPTGSLIREIRQNSRLIATFLLVGGCTVFLDAGQTTEFVYELMRQSGVLKDYATPSNQVRGFVEILSGCHEYAKKSATDVFNDVIAEVCRLVAGPNRQRSIASLNHRGNLQKLAAVFHEVVTKLQDAEVELVLLRGSRQGIWLAFLFIWLRPADVEVFLRTDRVFPTSDQEDSNAPGQKRLMIRFEDETESWHVEVWRAARGPLPVVRFEVTNRHKTDLYAQHSSPLKSARNMLILNGLSVATVDAIGHLAGAIVAFATESGRLSHGHESRKLTELCSHYFLEKYNTIMNRFGWDLFLDAGRQDKIKQALMSSQSAFHASTDTGIRGLENWIDRACAVYMEEHRMNMLLSPDEIKQGGKVEGIVIEHAIHLAGQALMFSMCAEIPMNALFQPAEPKGIEKHAHFICSLVTAGEASGKDPASRGYDFTTFRTNTLETLVPTSAVIGPGDLALASDGYVVYSGVVQNLDTDGRGLTDIRSILAFHLAPGPLKIRNSEGVVCRLTEDTHFTALASRTIDVRPSIITLYQADKCCLDERDANNRFGFEIIHLWRSDNALGPQTIHVRTYIKSKTNQGLIQYPGAGEQNIPTNWELSIRTLAFANHIISGYSSPTQLKLLAGEWERKGYLGGKLQWCPVGMLDRVGVRYVTVTSNDERLRFFEAGNLGEKRKVFVRHRSTSLFECIKQAMEICGDDPNWVIIS
ncbi:hypothetical protein N656DRAFT_799552 [Canariomyces notabilis]|uniref:Uncharacterized protein n=1 Tax=Canariomyces notabilis TaxID=2074819 RepID=A0AAN6TB15_9PEZI|nr:hypothetical protein N656DRAFT_799552 [Canariomyces arenarius]